MLASVGPLEVIVILIYFFAMGYLGWLGYKRTHSASDYLLAGRKAHPLVMGLSYGSTFISTSAIVGFGGVASNYGMSMLWLVFLNIFVGIFIAFTFLGGPTRRLGHLLDAHTFPELLGRRFQSRFVQVFSGATIFLFMPLYAAAVMIGGAVFFASVFSFSGDATQNYNIALFVFAIIVAAYVLIGGMKSVMYTDALQGAIMMIGMVILLVFTYSMVGGVTQGHRGLSSLSDLLPQSMKDQGLSGWTATPQFGFGAANYNLWWIIFSTLVLGVGIGVLSQPQLVVRFMTVKSKKELNRAIPIGGLFILLLPGTAYVVGNLSNVYFTQHGQVTAGRIVKTLQQPGHVLLMPMKQDDQGRWQDAQKAKPIPAVVDASIPAMTQEAASAGAAPISVVSGRTIAIVNGKGDVDQVIPAYITSAMPKWFSVVFMLTLLAAAMSTLSSQFHVMGTSIGRDFYQAVRGETAPTARTVFIVRIAMLIGIAAAVTFAYYIRGDIIARATALFFALCSTVFLPTFLGALFWKRMTKAGAIASMVVGGLVDVGWLLLVKEKEAGAIGLVQMLTGGKTSLLAGYPNWPVVDSLIIALPASILTAVIVSLLTKPPSQVHLERCFAKSD